MVRAIATHQFFFFLLEKLQKRAQGPEGARRRFAEGPPKKPKWSQTFYQNFEYREVKQWTLTKTGHFKVNHESRSVRCRIALWDCCGYAIAALIGCYKVARKLGQNSFPRKSPVVQPDTTPTQSQTQLKNDQYFVPSP